MEGVLHNQNLVAVFPIVFVRVQTSQFDGGFIGLGAAVTEKGLISEGVFYQKPSQPGLRLNMIEVGNVQQTGRLLSDGLYYGWVSVSQVIDPDSGEKITIFLSVRVPHPGAFPSDKNHGRPPISVGQICLCS